MIFGFEFVLRMNSGSPPSGRWSAGAGGEMPARYIWVGRMEVAGYTKVRSLCEVTACIRKLKDLRVSSRWNDSSCRTVQNLSPGLAAGYPRFSYTGCHTASESPTLGVFI